MIPHAIIKTVIGLSLFVICITGRAQSPVRPETPTCIECPSGFITISQLKDVKTSDAYYEALQNLMEKYAIDVAACNEQTFGGNLPLTNAMVIAILNTSLDRMMDVISSLSSAQKDKLRNDFEATLQPNSFDPYQHSFTSIVAIKDVKVTDCFYANLQSLTERYSINITNKAGLLKASKPANARMLAQLLKTVMHLKAFSPGNYPKPVITKGEFMLMLGKALDEYYSIITDLAKSMGR